jgi:hypothetical protein
MSWAVQDKRPMVGLATMEANMTRNEASALAIRRMLDEDISVSDILAGLAINMGHAEAVAELHGALTLIELEDAAEAEASAKTKSAAAA